jgi:hypothetical protein
VWIKRLETKRLEQLFKEQKYDEMISSKP